MKYLERFKYFENVSVINSYIQDVNDILLELNDDNWNINIDYIPKRWENPSANHIIKSDYISVVIKKKKNETRLRYLKGSEFKFSEVSEYINRIVDYFMTTDYKISICTSDSSDDRYIKGKWSDAKSIDDNDDLLGIEVIIYLQGSNLDDFKYKFK